MNYAVVLKDLTMFMICAVIMFLTYRLGYINGHKNITDDYLHVSKKLERCEELIDD